MALYAFAPVGLAAAHWSTQAEVVQRSVQARNLPQSVVDVAQTTLWVSHVLFGPTDASAQSSHDSVCGAQLMKPWTKLLKAPETRTLAPTFVQSGSPNDVMPATRVPAGVSMSAGPPESP